MRRACVLPRCKISSNASWTLHVVLCCGASCFLAKGHLSLEPETGDTETLRTLTTDELCLSVVGSAPLRYHPTGVRQCTPAYKMSARGTGLADNRRTATVMINTCSATGYCSNMSPTDTKNNFPLCVCSRL